MSKPMSPRVKFYRDALRSRREAAEAAANRRGNPENDPWASPQKDWNPADSSQPVRPVSGSGNDPWAEPDPHFQPAGDAQDGLHSFLDNLDAATVKEAAEDALRGANTEGRRDVDEIREQAEEILNQINEAEAEEVAERFIASESRWVCDNDNFVVLLQKMIDLFMPGTRRVREDNTSDTVTLLFLNDHWTVPKIQQAFDVIWPNFPVHEEGTARPATELEKRAAQTRAAAGDTQGAVLYLMSKVYPDLEERINLGAEDIFEVLGDPIYREGLLDVVLTVFGASHAGITSGYRDTQANRQAIADVLGDRPCTIGTVQAAWAQVQRSKQPRSLEEQSAAARNRVPTEEDLDDLDDDEVESLFNGVAADRARRLKGLL